jgi:hypothetical protein
MSDALTRTQRDLLSILVFREPQGCWLVPTRSGAARYALVVPEMVRERTWARLRTVGDPTVDKLLDAGLIRMGMRTSAIPQYSGRRPCDGTVGCLVHPSTAGYRAINADPPLSMPLSCAPQGTVAMTAELMARIRDETRGLPEGCVDNEIRALRNGDDDELTPPRMCWVPFNRTPGSLGEALGGHVYALLDGEWINIETSFAESDPTKLRGVVELGPAHAGGVLDSVPRQATAE